MGNTNDNSRAEGQRPDLARSTSDRLVEIGRCVHSATGSLEAIRDGLPDGCVQAVELAGLVDGGMPALVELVMGAIADAGTELPDERREKSMARGYQHIILMRRESAGEEVTREEWAESPIAFMERLRAAPPEVTERTAGDDVLVQLRVRRANLPALEAGRELGTDQLTGGAISVRLVKLEDGAYALECVTNPLAMVLTPDPVDVQRVDGGQDA